MFKYFIALLLTVALIGCSSAAPPSDSGENPSDAPAPATVTADAQTAPEASATNTPAPAATETPTPEPTATPVPEPTATPAPEPIIIQFSGQGDSIEGPFTLEEGIVSFTAQHSGSSNFVVKIFGGDSQDELSINEIGDYSGERAHPIETDSLFGLKPGAHSFEITADGPWTIDLLQEFPTSGDSVPISANGSGDGVVRWLLLEEGNHILQANHQGGSNFVVRLLDAQGTNDELVINEIGDYSGQNRLNVEENNIFGLEPGIHMVVVVADGDWDLSVTK